MFVCNLVAVYTGVVKYSQTSVICFSFRVIRSFHEIVFNERRLGWHIECISPGPDWSICWIGGGLGRQSINGLPRKNVFFFDRKFCRTNGTLFRWLLHFRMFLFIEIPSFLGFGRIRVKFIQIFTITCFSVVF